MGLSKEKREEWDPYTYGVYFMMCSILKYILNGFTVFLKYFKK
jgi:hypothetical protein